MLSATRGRTALANRGAPWRSWARAGGAYIIAIACGFTLALVGFTASRSPLARSQLALTGFDEPFFDGLGPYRRPVNTTSGKAQCYFDQGLAFLFAFNHDEAIRSFEAASAADPACAMSYWGIAMANGPHINNMDVSEEHAAAAWEAVTAAVPWHRTRLPLSGH